MYLELQWGRILSMLVDTEKVIGKERERATVSDIFTNTLMYVISCCKSWTKYGVHKEDLISRKKERKCKYDGMRVVIRDATNADFDFKLSGAYGQTTIWSSYYSGNCAKDGVLFRTWGGDGGGCELRSCELEQQAIYVVNRKLIFSNSRISLLQSLIK